MLRKPGEAVNVSGSGGERPEPARTQIVGQGAASSPPPSGAQGPSVGDEIDDFLLIDELGQGAFARVFLAHQKSLRRTVALKVFTDPSREAQTLAQVDHANIVRVHDQRHVAGERTQLLYMEYVPGGTLEAVVARVGATSPDQRSGRLLLDTIDETLARRGEKPPLDSMLRERLGASTWPEAVCLLGAHMAVALDFAHSRGVLHRDMKPANVLLDATGRAKLADFNISSATDPAEGDAAVGGTLPYMAPEQVRAVSAWHEGGATDLDERTDLYGLGVVLWELLTGDLPFPEPPEGAGMQEVIEHLLETREAGVSEAAEAQARALAHPMVVDTLLACLAPDPQDRPTDGAEVRRRLEWCLDPDLRRLFADPKGGSFCARTKLCRFPLCGLVLTVLIPNGLLSALNVTFNLDRVIQRGKTAEEAEAAKQAFMQVVTLVNGIAFPLGIGIFLIVGWAMRRVVRARIDDVQTTPDARRLARKRGLRLGGTMAAVILPLWILGGLVFPIWQQMHDGYADHDAWFAFTVSNTLFGLLAATLSFFLINALASRVLLPRLVEPGDVDAENAARALRLRGRLGWYFAGCTIVPLLAVMLLAVAPAALREEELAFLALGIMGTLAFAASMSLNAQIRRDLAALERALAPPKDRFRAPV